MRRRLAVIAVVATGAAATLAPTGALAAITPVKKNGGGNTPNGQANGVPTENQNPAGHAPPGQNP
jgi:hypothetical protein